MSVISDKMAQLINEQIAHELANRMQYLMFSNWFANQGLKNLAKFWKGEADGELGHSDKFVAYLAESNTALKVPAIEQKVQTFNGCEDIANIYIEAESDTTAHLKVIWDLTNFEDDAGTGDLMQWYMREQVEEEGNAERFSNLVDLANGDLIKLDLAIGG